MGSEGLYRATYKPVDETGLADLDKDGIVDEIPGLRGIGSGIEVEHGLNRGSGDEEQSFPRACSGPNRLPIPTQIGHPLWGLSSSD